MRRPGIALGLTLVPLVALLTACPGPEPFPVDPSCGRTGCFDAGRPFPSEDAGPVELGSPCASSGFGLPCASGCTGPVLSCFGERRTTAEVANGEDTATLDVVAFPGGLCTARCTVDDECGACARCVDFVLAGRARLAGPLGGSGVCRPRCDGIARCPSGYACDPEVGACVEACTDDVQCRFSTVDTDGDGADDMLAYDAESTMICGGGRCTSDPGASLGGTCFGGAVCEDGLVCLFDAERSRSGSCGRAGCTSDASCGAGGACIERADGTTMCAYACAVGAEDEGARIGASGAGAGCPFGLACFHHGPGSTDGVCTPGAYNEQREPNVGVTCAHHSDCYSPYGRGRCLRARRTDAEGVCAVEECVPGEPEQLWPDVPAALTICDQTCLPPAVGRDRSLCVVACETPDDCLPGWACAALPGEGRACFGNCVADEDCRAGTTCHAPDGSTCDDADRDCVCT